MKIKYLIGTKSYTEEYTKENSLIFLQKQLKLSVPLITGVNISYKEELKKQIYVGKEIQIKNFSKDNYILSKYDISPNELRTILENGYERACLLSYKKYETILVGVKKEDIIVPDYFALKEELLKI